MEQHDIIGTYLTVVRLLRAVWLANMPLMRNKEGGGIADVKAKVPNERAPIQSPSDNIIV